MVGLVLSEPCLLLRHLVGQYCMGFFKRMTTCTPLLSSKPKFTLVYNVNNIFSLLLLTIGNTS